jgi:hypothetical protein
MIASGSSAIVFVGGIGHVVDLLDIMITQYKRKAFRTHDHPVYGPSYTQEEHDHG